MGTEGIWEGVAGVVAVGNKSKARMIPCFIVFCRANASAGLWRIIQQTVPASSSLTNSNVSKGIQQSFHVAVQAELRPKSLKR